MSNFLRHSMSSLFLPMNQETLQNAGISSQVDVLSDFQPKFCTLSLASDLMWSGYIDHEPNMYLER